MIRELKGHHVLAIALMAFGVIIAVNIVMAYQAVSTFPGLEVKNSYVASQRFDRERAAQENLGWTAVPSYEDGVVSLRITDQLGHPVEAKTLTATIGRPTHIRDDVTPDFTYYNGTYFAPLKLAPGRWNIRIEAEAADGTRFHQRLTHYHGAEVAK